MMQKKWAALGAAAALTLALSACGGSASSPTDSDASSTEQPIGGDVISPVTMGVNELQGAEIELLVGQVLNIDTESLAVDSYTGEVSDPSVAEFTEGHDDGSAQFNPGVTGLAVGTAQVTMVNEQGGIQPLEFTVTVVEQ